MLVIALACSCGHIGYNLLDEPLEGGGGEPADARTDIATTDVAATDVATPGADGPADGPVADEGVVDVAEARPDSGCVTSPVVDYCTSIPPLDAPPVIDGVLDCGPTLVPMNPEDWRGAAPLPPFPAGNSAELAVAWRPGGLYVFMAVTTPAAIPADPQSPDYYGAGVELFVDQNGVFANPPSYNDPGTVQLLVTSPPYVAPDASTSECPDAPSDASSDASPDALDETSTDASLGQRGEQYRNEVDLGAWTSTQFGTFATPTGFVFEGFVVAADLGVPSWSLAAGATVGFDLAVDVSFPVACMTGLEGHRAGQYFLNVSVSPPDAAADAAPVGPPFEDVRSFCTPTLTSM
jgi:hypothetical protein